MTLILTEQFEGGSNGAAVTISNTAFNVVNAGSGSITFTNSPVLVGSLAARVQLTGTSSSCFMQVSSTILGTRSFLWSRLYVYVPALPLPEQVFIQAVNSSGAARAQMRINTNGTVAVRNNALVAWTSTTALQVGENSVSWRVDSTNNQQQARLYVGANWHGTTPDQDSGNQTYNMGTFDTYLCGVTVAAANVDLTFDSVKLDDSTEPGPEVVANVPPTVTLTASQTEDVEPGSTVTLTATPADSDGTITDVTFAQTDGTPTVTLTDLGDTATFPFPFTMTGTTLTFTATATDNGGATATSDPVTVTGFPAPIRVVAGGVLVPTDLRLPDTTATTTRGLGYIGDGLTYQADSGAARASLLGAGWPDALLEVDGLPDRTMAVAGVTHPNAGEVIDAWRARDFDPYTWVIALGTHNLGATDTKWTTMAGEILDKIAEGPRAGYVVNWVGTSLADAADTRPIRFIAVLDALVGTRAKITLQPIDWNAYVHDGRDETGLWDASDTVGRWMTVAGYDLRNDYITAQVGTPT